MIRPALIAIATFAAVAGVYCQSANASGSFTGEAPAVAAPADARAYYGDIQDAARALCGTDRACFDQAVEATVDKAGFAEVAAIHRIALAAQETGAAGRV